MMAHLIWFEFGTSLAVPGLTHATKGWKNGVSTWEVGKLLITNEKMVVSKEPDGPTSALNVSNALKDGVRSSRQLSNFIASSFLIAENLEILVDPTHNGNRIELLSPIVGTLRRKHNV
jgi:hypothetical protein